MRTRLSGGFWRTFQRPNSAKRSSKTNHSCSPQLERLEARNLLAGVVISEFLASNDNLLRDEDRNRSDWIELLNTNSEQVNLEGWFLTDDPNDLDRWKFPDVNLNPNERVVVFASEKTRTSPDGELHTNFRLKASGDYLALVQPDGLTVEFDFGPTYPPQIPDVSFGLPQPTSEANVISPGDSSRLLIPTEGNGGSNLELSWTEAGFDDSSWTEVTTGIGYEKRSGYEDFISTNLETEMYGVNSSAYLRFPFVLNAPQSVYSLTLDMQYDDGYVAYINGQEIARRQAPGELSWNSAATDAHKDKVAIVPEAATIDMSRFPDLLTTGTNVLAIHALNDEIQSSDFLMIPALSLRTFGDLRSTDRHYFTNPTPGDPNQIGTVVAITSATHEPEIPTQADTLNVKATLFSTTNQISDVTLHYRHMFDDEVSVPMHDDGLHGDGAADDGVYGASIPAGIAAPAEMIRYRITASSTDQDLSSFPTFADPVDNRKYLGTVVADPSIQSNLDVLHLFLEDPAASEVTAGTTGALFHDGNFYDNIFIDTTGRTVGLAGPKKSHDIFFTSENWFELEQFQFRMNDFDIISDFWNRAKVRIPLAFETFRNIGTPAHFSMPVRIQRNGEFFATYSFVDGGNEQFLARAGLDPGGALYKMNLGFNTGRGQSKKQTRRHENTDDLRAFFKGLSLEGEELTRFLLDNVDIAATNNYLVGLVAMGHGDCCNKNLYIYRDTEDTGLWEPLPWDVDSAFGRGGVGRAKDIFPTAAPLFTGRDNRLFDALFEHVPGFREMYLRRIKTVLDDVLQPPGTPQEELKFEQRVDELVALMEPDAVLDYQKWGTWKTHPETEVITFGKEELSTWMDHINILKDEYFPTRRTFLYNQLTSANRGEVLQPQAAVPAIQFGQIDFNPISGDQDEEFIEITNPSELAVDLSGWQLVGGIEHTIQPGTVIPAGGSLYLTPNRNSFLSRSSGPGRGQGLFVQGNYLGHLSNFGSSVRLLTPELTLVTEFQTETSLTTTQQFLRVSELMYHPRDTQAGDRFETDDFEFIELVNTSNTETINLNNVRFSEGIHFDFPNLMLAPGERVVTVRNEDAFVSRYGSDIRVIGEYGRTAEDYKLSNGGESIRLEIASGDLIQQFTYDDEWFTNTDGEGFSLNHQDLTGNTTTWNSAAAWTSSVRVGGTPGSAETIAGDFNNDAQIDQTDIGLLCQAIPTGETRFDLNEDGIVGQRDLEVLVEDLANTSFGDANLDGVFNADDLLQIFQAGEYEDQALANSTWGEGDWDCSGEFDTSDVVLAFKRSQYIGQGEQPIAAKERTLSNSDLGQIAAARPGTILTRQNANEFAPKKSNLMLNVENSNPIGQATEIDLETRDLVFAKLERHPLQAEKQESNRQEINDLEAEESQAGQDTF
ncbi:MAG: hypothetical protein GY768_24365 [Planctomycetaceae bacterium]|nr:hypothetical protein [Planctomycetaceae bacterium]